MTCSILSRVCSIPAASCSIPAASCSIPAAGCSIPAAATSWPFSTSCMHVGAVQQAASQMVRGKAITDKLDYSGSKSFSRNGRR